MDSIIIKLESEYKKASIPTFKAGDKVKISLKVKDGNNERIQIFEGDVIARKGAGLKESIVVRKISNGIGVEKILPLHSPKIDKIEVVKIGKVRRAKLYYLRDRIGKSAKIVEKIQVRKDKVAKKEPKIEAVAVEAVKVETTEKIEKINKTVKKTKVVKKTENK